MNSEGGQHDRLREVAAARQQLDPDGSGESSGRESNGAGRRLDKAAIDALIDKGRRARLAELDKPYELDLAPRERTNVRVEAGLRLRDISEVIGVTAPTISRWEHGAPLRGPNAKNYVTVMLALVEAAEQEGATS